MKLFLVLAYVLGHNFVDGQQCTDLPPLATIEGDFYFAVNASEQAGNTFILGELFFNCITYGSPNGSIFRETTITATYEVDDGTFQGQVLYVCVEINETVLWLISPDGVRLKTGLRENNTERCSGCREPSMTTCDGQ